MYDTYDIDGYDNIQYHTPADLLPFGLTAKIGYAPSGNASTADDYAATGAQDGGVAANAETTAAGGLTITAGGTDVTHFQVKANAIPMLDGLEIGADYIQFGNVSGAADQEPESGAYYAKYTAGPAVIGYSKNFTAFPVNLITADRVESVENKKYSISFNVNDNLSVSYENEKSQPQTTRNAAQMEMESDGLQAAYTMGGMTLGIAMNNHDNATYTENNDVKETMFSVEMAF